MVLQLNFRNRTFVNEDNNWIESLCFKNLRWIISDVKGILATEVTTEFAAHGGLYDHYLRLLLDCKRNFMPSIFTSKRFFQLLNTKYLTSIIQFYI